MTTDNLDTQINEGAAGQRSTNAPSTSPNPASARNGAQARNVSAPLSIQDLTVAYHRKPVLWDVDYTAPAGSLVAIVGPNGAGKSTLLKAVLDLIPRVSGRVQFFGQSYRKQRGLVGYVPQRESVDWDFPVTAIDVVAICWE